MLITRRHNRASRGITEMHAHRSILLDKLLIGKLSLETKLSIEIIIRKHECRSTEEKLSLETKQLCPFVQ